MIGGERHWSRQSWFGAGISPLPWPDGAGSLVAGQGVTSRDPHPRCAGGLVARMLAQGAAQVHVTIPEMWLHRNQQEPMCGNRGIHSSRRGLPAWSPHSLGSGLPKAVHV